MKVRTTDMATFIRRWSTMYWNEYNKRKAKGLPCAMDVFDNYKGPIFTKKKRVK